MVGGVILYTWLGGVILYTWWGGGVILYFSSNKQAHGVSALMF